MQTLWKKKRERAREGSDSDEDEEASSSSSLPRSKSIIMDYLLKTTESDKEISQTEVEIKGMEIEIQKQEWEAQKKRWKYIHSKLFLILAKKDEVYRTSQCIFNILTH